MTDEPPGVFITTTPRRVAASRSTLSTPTPARPIDLEAGRRASRSFAVTFVALRTASAVVLADDRLAAPRAGARPSRRPRARRARRISHAFGGEVVRHEDARRHECLLVRSSGARRGRRAARGGAKPGYQCRAARRQRAERLRSARREPRSAAARRTPPSTSSTTLALRPLDVLLGRLRRMTPTTMPGEGELERAEQARRGDHRDRARRGARPRAWPRRTTSATSPSADSKVWRVEPARSAFGVRATSSSRTRTAAGAVRKTSMAKPADRRELLGRGARAPPRWRGSTG